jgi:hypothetical protein
MGLELAVHQLVRDCNKVGWLFPLGHTLYNIVIKLGIATKLVRLIKRCVNEMFSEVHMDKHMLMHFQLRFN